MKRISQIMIMLVIMGLLTACSESSVAQKSNVVLTKEKHFIQPDSLVVQCLGESVCNVLFSPSKVVCYQVEPTFGGGSDSTKVFLEARRMKIAQIDQSKYTILQFLIADSTNYDFSLEEPKCFFSPYFVFTFSNRKESVTVYMSFNCKKWAFENNGEVKMFKYNCQGSLLRFCKGLFPGDPYINELVKYQK